MELNEFIAAIDLGTSKITGIIGTRDVTGSLTIHALEKEETEGCIKRGCIQNVDETALKVKRLITKLENRARVKIGKIYIGYGGQSIHSMDHKVTRQLTEETLITDQIINSLKNESMQLPLNGKDILNIIPSEYYIDGKKTLQPVGVYGSEIEATHKLIVGKQAIIKNLKRVIEKIDMEVAECVLAPIATNLVLSEPDKSLGCILVDFGAGTTTVSVYKEGLLRHLAVLPLGGNSITKDITSLQILENVAEKLKIHYGNANPDNEDNEDNFLTPDKKNGIDSPEIMIGTLNNVIQCRYEEIIENILNQVKLSGYEKQLASGYILTGGASNMKGLKELFKKKTDAEVKQGYFQRQIACRNVPELGRETAFASLLGLMVRGTINCKKKEVIVEPVIVEPVKPEPTPTEKQQPNDGARRQTNPKAKSIMRLFGDLFKEDADEQTLDD